MTSVVRSCTAKTDCYVLLYCVLRYHRLLLRFSIGSLKDRRSTRLCTVSNEPCALVLVAMKLSKVGYHGPWAMAKESKAFAVLNRGLVQNNALSENSLPDRRACI